MSLFDHRGRRVEQAAPVVGQPWLANLVAERCTAHRLELWGVPRAPTSGDWMFFRGRLARTPTEAEHALIAALWRKQHLGGRGGAIGVVAFDREPSGGLLERTDAAYRRLMK